MKRLTIQLNQSYKSFLNDFNATLEGDLTILSGVNGAGKSQIINIILGYDKISNINIQSKIKINDVEIKKEDIDFRSFKENIAITEITVSTSQTFLESANNAWIFYKDYRLDPLNNNVAQYLDSFIEAKNILLQSFSEQEFNNFEIQEKEFKEKLRKSDFVLRIGDKFTNTIGEIFFSHALKISEKMKEVSKKSFQSSMLEEAPWDKLNNLFSQLKLDYRFKTNYEIVGVEINEQPNLYAVKIDGTIDESNSRKLSDLSDGEKTIISLCFASLSGSNATAKKLLLLDELDSVLNPSLIQIFFAVLKEFFIDKGVMVIMTTHSPATIALSPNDTKYYEIFKSNQTVDRILEVPRNEYSELKIANKEFYDKISDQNRRIESLLKDISSDQEILIITEGKTDWKYILAALKYYESNGEFSDIREEFFYRFGSGKDVAERVCGCDKIDELSVSQLSTYLNSLKNIRKIDTNHTKIRIGIFDSDTNNVLVNEENKKIFSFKIKPDNISTELLFNDNEIKTEIEGKRLYIGDEFHSKTKRNINNSNLNLGGNSSNINKAGRRTIIDTNVYNEKGEDIALSKEKFARAVFNDEVKISKESWENFRHIFEQIQACIDAGN
jgi:ABC-type multidrug transport system ATPase subunit